MCLSKEGDFMKLDINSIIKDIGASIAFTETERLEELKSGIGTVEFTSPVEFKGSVTSLKGMVVLEGKAQVNYTTVCDRCGERLERTLSVPVKEGIVEIKNAELKAEQENPDDRFSFSGHVLELDGIVTDAILLNLPMQHLCRDDCSGLCPLCGEKITGQVCGCSNVKQSDPRFESLKEYFKE